MTTKAKNHTTTSSNGTGHKTDDPIDPIDLEAAKAILRFARGGRLTKKTHRKILKLERWGELLETLEQSEPGHRLA